MFRLLFILCWMLPLTAPARADDARLDWDSAAQAVAEHIEQTLAPREGSVVHIDPDSRHVYFTGMGPKNLAGGAPVQFFLPHESAGGEAPIIGEGSLVSAIGQLSWAEVDPAAGARITRRTRVRLDPAFRQTAILPFVHRDSHAARVTAMASIFRSLVLHYLNERGFAFLPGGDTVGAGAAVAAELSADEPGIVSIRVDIAPLFDGATAFSRTYGVAAWAGFPLDAARTGADEAGAAGLGSAAAGPPGALRIALARAPLAAATPPFEWPPASPADRFMIGALGWSLADFPRAPGADGRMVFRLPAHTPAGFAARAAQSLNSRRSLPAAEFLLGKYQFTALSDTELALKCERGGGWLDAALADPLFALVDPLDPSGSLGDGPYAVADRSARTITFARRAALFPEKMSRAPETAVVHFDPDPASRQQRFDLRETDFHWVGDDRWADYAQSTAWLERIARTPPGSVVTLVFHTGHEWTNDPAVRRSIVSHLDRQATLDVLLNGRGRAAESFGPGDELSRDRGLSMPKPPGEKAAVHRKLTKPVTLTLAAPAESAELMIIADRIRTELKPLGIHLRVPDEPWERYAKRLQSGDFDLALTTGMPADDARLDLARQFQTGAPRNWARYSSPVFDRLIRDPAFLQQAHDMLLIDLPAAPLFRLSRVGVWQGRVRAVTPGAAEFSIRDFQF